MKKILIALNLVVWSVVCFEVAHGAEPVKKEETNCVTKDKKGNCPPAPKSPKPTPKKKAEEKK
jgi:hypothetical protein